MTRPPHDAGREGLSEGEGHSLSEDFATGLLRKQGQPRLSIYQPTHRNYPERRQDPIRFQNLVSSLERTAAASLSEGEVAKLFRPLRELAAREEFWRRTRDGIAVLAAPGFLRVYVLARPTPERAVVADTFHTKPLLRVLQSADGYQVLALHRDRIRLFEGNRDALDEVELAAGVPRTIAEALGEQHTEAHGNVHGHHQAGGRGAVIHHGQGAKKDELHADTERFFREVDRAIHERHSRPSGLPLLLAALPEHHSRFRGVSRNPLLLARGIDGNPDALSLEELRTRAWSAVSPTYLERLSALSDRFGAARATGHGAEAAADVARACVEGRVRTLMVDADREIRGRVDGRTGEISVGPAGEVGMDDILDDIAELALSKGGEVVIVPSDRMPTKTGLAAILSH